MADQDKQSAAQRRISTDDRFRYIGFDVFPGKPGELFASEAERTKLVDAVVSRRSRGERLREQCTLMIERISGYERWIMVLASLIILASLFMPWFTVYQERVIESTPTATVAKGSDERGEVLVAGQARKKVERTTETTTGIGAFGYLGNVFGGGFGLMLSGLFGVLFLISSIALPIYMLMILFKGKKMDDLYALQLKRLLRLNWIPVILFVLALVASFMGGGYASSAASAYANLGTSYGPGAFLSVLSYGLVVTVGAFVLLAIKGVEI